MTYPPAAAPHEPYYAPGWPARRPRTDGLAVASFVTAVVGVGLVGIGLGVAALARIRTASSPGERHGRGLALAGIAIGAVWTVVQAVVGVSAVSAFLATRPLPLAVDGPRDAFAVQLATGHCVAELPARDAVGRVPVVPCTDPHAAQVVSEFRFAPDAVWPGQDDADALVAAGCELSTGELAAGLDAVIWAPTEATWDDGDRTGLCLAHRDAPFTGSLLDGTADLG